MDEILATNLTFRELKKSKEWIKWLDIIHWLGYIVVILVSWQDVVHEYVRNAPSDFLLFIVDVVTFSLFYFIGYKLLIWLLVKYFQQGSNNKARYVFLVIVIVMLFVLAISLLPIALLYLLGV